MLEIKGSGFKVQGLGLKPNCEDLNPIPYTLHFIPRTLDAQTIIVSVGAAFSRDSF